MKDLEDLQHLSHEIQELFLIQWMTAALRAYGLDVELAGWISHTLISIGFFNGLIYA